MIACSSCSGIKVLKTILKTILICLLSSNTVAFGQWL